MESGKEKTEEGREGRQEGREGRQEGREGRQEGREGRQEVIEGGETGSDRGREGRQEVIEKERDKKQSISIDLFKKAFGSERADLVVSSFSVDDIHAAQDEPPEPWQREQHDGAAS